LDEPPHFGAADADLVGDFRATDYDGGMVAQEADNPAEADIGFL